MPIIICCDNKYQQNQTVSLTCDGVVFALGAVIRAGRPSHMARAPTKTPNLNGAKGVRVVKVSLI